MKKILFLFLIMASVSFSKTQSVKAYDETKGVIGAGIGSIAGGIIGEIGGGTIGGAIGSIAGPGGTITGVVIGDKFGGTIGSGLGGIIGNYLIPFSNKNKYEILKEIEFKNEIKNLNKFILEDSNNGN